MHGVSILVKVPSFRLPLFRNNLADLITCGITRNIIKPLMVDNN